MAFCRCRGGRKDFILPHGLATKRVRSIVNSRAACILTRIRMRDSIRYSKRHKVGIFESGAAII
ncbi:hypothetical protein GGR38_002711 [Novosphingobium sediminicola]|uniref:Uncharacterized protein n=1 Tax=Novosphingobium sediminicola TaxID=563162 RepID=A0A7W6CHU6_9SPHN|nr:hypothetical protein [Novosphingobium sediminicola]